MRKGWEWSCEVVTALACYFEQNSWVIKQAGKGTTGHERPLSSKRWCALLCYNEPGLLWDDFSNSLSNCWGLFGFFIFPFISRFNSFSLAGLYSVLRTLSHLTEGSSCLLYFCRRWPRLADVKISMIDILYNPVIRFLKEINLSALFSFTPLVHYV